MSTPQIALFGKLTQTKASLLRRPGSWSDPEESLLNGLLGLPWSGTAFFSLESPFLLGGFFMERHQLKLGPKELVSALLLAAASVKMRWKLPLTFFFNALLQLQSRAGSFKQLLSLLLAPYLLQRSGMLWPTKVTIWPTKVLPPSSSPQLLFSRNVGMLVSSVTPVSRTRGH